MSSATCLIGVCNGVLIFHTNRLWALEECYFAYSFGHKDKFSHGWDIWSECLATERWGSGFLSSWFASVKLPLGEFGSCPCLHMHCLTKKPIICFKQSSTSLTGKSPLWKWAVCRRVHVCEMLKSEQITDHRQKNSREMWIITIILLIWMALYIRARLSYVLWQSTETAKFYNSMRERKQRSESLPSQKMT